MGQVDKVKRHLQSRLFQLVSVMSSIRNDGLGDKEVSPSWIFDALLREGNIDSLITTLPDVITVSDPSKCLVVVKYQMYRR